MSRQSRKLEHIELAMKSQESLSLDAWRDFRFVHRSLPEIRVSDISLETHVGGRLWRTPLYINAMTGGAEGTADINRSLAEIASNYGLAMAVGSQRSGIVDDQVAYTYRVVREQLHNGIVLANIGADAQVDEAQRAVDMLQADYLQLHLNTVQEMVMPEGDRSFVGILRNIEQIVQSVQTQVIVKEVGFGMSMEVYRQLQSVGVSLVDVGGKGGTNFAFIENARRVNREMTYFEDWGQTTLESLLEAQAFQGKMEWMASGGIRTPLDMAKALALGASAVGVAGAILRVLQTEGTEAVVDLVRGWLDGLVSIMAVLGASEIKQLTEATVVIGGETANWCQLRGIPIENLARRQR